MSIWDITFLSCVFVLACTGQAAYEAHMFANKKTINHFVHGLYYGVFCALMAIACGLLAEKWVIVIKVFLFGVIARAAFFDPILNIMRKKEFWYNATTLSNHGSWLDWLENRLLNYDKPGGVNRVIILKIGYLLIWIIYVIFIF